MKMRLLEKAPILDYDPEDNKEYLYELEFVSTCNDEYDSYIYRFNKKENDTCVGSLLININSYAAADIYINNQHDAGIIISMNSTTTSRLSYIVGLIWWVVGSIML